MPFPKRYIDPDKYVSLHEAARISGYSYSYMTRLVNNKKIARAPISEAVMVSVESLSDYVNLTPIRREALLIAAEYDTVCTGRANQWGRKVGCIGFRAASFLVEQGWLEKVAPVNDLETYRITEEGRRRVR